MYTENIFFGNLQLYIVNIKIGYPCCISCQIQIQILLFALFRNLTLIKLQHQQGEYRNGKKKKNVQLKPN